MERWKGRTALVTGGSEGIGEAIVKNLLQHGLKVAACARHIEKFQPLEREAEHLPGNLLVIKCDLKQENDIVAMFARINQQFEGVDILVNNAGTACFKVGLLEGDTQHWRDMLDVNVLAVAICSREAIQNMRHRGVDDGHVININSMSGHRITTKETGFYAITKSGVCTFTEALRKELREINSHIRVTSISPGIVATLFDRKVCGKYDDTRSKPEKELEPTMKAHGTKDIVDAVVYALSAPPHVQVHDILMRPTEQAL